MKKIIFLPVLGLICLIYSCNTPASSNTAAGGTDTAYVNKIKNLNIAFYKGFETNDMSNFDTSNVMAGVIDHGMGLKDVVGIDSVRNGLSKMNSQFKNLKFEITAQTVDSNYSMTWVRMTGVSASPETGFPVGTPVDMMSVDVVRWENGKAAEHWGYMDPRDMMKMMPPSPMPKPMDSTMHK
jgi:hypothetical protein